MAEAPIFDDDRDELPPAVADSISSWRRVFAMPQRTDDVHGLLLNAARDLFGTCKVSKIWRMAWAFLPTTLNQPLPVQHRAEKRPQNRTVAPRSMIRARIFRRWRVQTNS
jgi:hypothetical protein